MNHSQNWDVYSFQIDGQAFTSSYALHFISTISTISMGQNNHVTRYQTLKRDLQNASRRFQMSEPDQIAVSSLACIPQILFCLMCGQLNLFIKFQMSYFLLVRHLHHSLTHSYLLIQIWIAEMLHAFLEIPLEIELNTFIENQWNFFLNVWKPFKIF